MMPEFIFDREEERLAIGQHLAKRRAFLIHGPSGAGKTLLLRSLLPEFSTVLYCEDSATTHVVFRSLANSLLLLRSPHARTALRNEEAIKTKSAVSLKGIVMDSLNEGQFAIVLDHLVHPSQSFATGVREMMSRGSTPVCAVARSSHMEDTGFLQPLYSDRTQKYEVRNFEKSVAEQFAREVVKRTNLTASNMNEFLDRIVQFSEGNPGAIVSLVKAAKHPKYRSEEHIKISPLYIDFRMNWRAAG